MHRKPMTDKIMNYRIIKTEEYEPLAELFDANGLHADPEEGRAEDSVALWRCEELVNELGNAAEEGNGKLIAAAELMYTAGVYVLRNIAVSDEYKSQGFGTILLAEVENEVGQRLGKDGDMWLCAKVPEFYRRFGWSEVDRLDAPDFTECFDCEEYGVTCFPKVMKKTVKYIK